MAVPAKGQKRTVVLHYHLFKNAGTSVDQALKTTFPDRWETREFFGSAGKNSAHVLEWILSFPDSIAFSSHTMTGPLPIHPELNIVPVILLRDPVKRIQSAYQFERHQVAETKGARLAKRTNFKGYVEHRLEHPGDRQCRNFQTSRLASFCPSDEAEFKRACSALTMLNTVGVVGLVERFDDTITELSRKIAHIAPQGITRNVRENQSKQHKDALSAALQSTIREANADDLALVDMQHDFMVKRFEDFPV